jgi:hypothetical protein
MNSIEMLMIESKAKLVHEIRYVKSWVDNVMEENFDVHWDFPIKKLCV